MIIRAVVFPIAGAVTASAWSYAEYSFRWPAISDLGNPDNEKLKGSFCQWN
jgi:hypothetical protein